MPRLASEVEKSPYLRLMVLGSPKAGKTVACVSTAPGPVYVINSDDPSALRPAGRYTQDFEWDFVRTAAEMEAALLTARKGVKEGKYRSVIWDTISNYAMRLEQELADASAEGNKGPDGRRYWPEYEKRLRNTCERLFHLKAHVVVISHYIDVGGEPNENQLSKAGPGIVPLLGGKARSTIPALFQDVVFFENRKGERVFVTSSEGVWGPGCRSLESNDVDVIPADLRKLMKAMGIVVKKRKTVEPAPAEDIVDAAVEPKE